MQETSFFENRFFQSVSYSANDGGRQRGTICGIETHCTRARSRWTELHSLCRRFGGKGCPAAREPGGVPPGSRAAARKSDAAALPHGKAADRRTTSGQKARRIKRRIPSSVGDAAPSCAPLLVFFCPSARRARALFLASVAFCKRRAKPLCAGMRIKRLL